MDSHSVVDIPNSCAAAVSSVLAEADERHAHGGMPAVHPTCTEILPGVDEIKARLMKALEANEGADVIGPLVEQLQRVEDSLHARKTTGLELAVVEPSVEEKLLKLKEEANKLAQLGARRKLGLEEDDEDEYTPEQLTAEAKRIVEEIKSGVSKNKIQKKLTVCAECIPMFKVTARWGLQDALKRTASWYCSGCSSMFCNECKLKHDQQEGKRQHNMFRVDASVGGDQGPGERLLYETFSMCKEWYQGVADEKERLAEVYKGLIEVASKVEHDSPTLECKCLESNLKWVASKNLGSGPAVGQVYTFEPWVSDILQIIYQLLRRFPSSEHLDHAQYSSHKNLTSQLSNGWAVYRITNEKKTINPGTKYQREVYLWQGTDSFNHGKQKTKDLQPPIIGEFLDVQAHVRKVSTTVSFKSPNRSYEELYKDVQDEREDPKLDKLWKVMQLIQQFLGPSSYKTAIYEAGKFGRLVCTKFGILGAKDVEDDDKFEKVKVDFGGSDLGMRFMGNQLRGLKLQHYIEAKKHIRILVVGDTNSGKSTLLNALFKEKDLLATQRRSLTALLTRVTHGETPRWRLQHISIRPGLPGADEGVTQWQGNEGTHANMHAYSAKGRSKDTAETPPLTKAFRDRFLAARAMRSFEVIFDSQHAEASGLYACVAHDKYIRQTQPSQQKSAASVAWMAERITVAPAVPGHKRDIKSTWIFKKFKSKAKLSNKALKSAQTQTAAFCINDVPSVSSFASAPADANSNSDALDNSNLSRTKVTNNRIRARRNTWSYGKQSSGKHTHLEKVFSRSLPIEDDFFSRSKSLQFFEKPADVAIKWQPYFFEHTQTLGIRNNVTLMSPDDFDNELADNQILELLLREQLLCVEVQHPTEILRGVEITDSPGLDDADSDARRLFESRLEADVKSADAFIYVSPGGHLTPSDQENLLKMLKLRQHRPEILTRSNRTACDMFFVVNKIDLGDRDERDTNILAFYDQLRACIQNTKNDGLKQTFQLPWQENPMFHAVSSKVQVDLNNNPEWRGGTNAFARFQRELSKRLSLSLFCELSSMIETVLHSIRDTRYFFTVSRHQIEQNFRGLHQFVRETDRVRKSLENGYSRVTNEWARAFRKPFYAAVERKLEEWRNVDWVNEQLAEAGCNTSMMVAGRCYANLVNEEYRTLLREQEEQSDFAQRIVSVFQNMVENLDLIKCTFKKLMTEHFQEQKQYFEKQLQKGGVTYEPQEISKLGFVAGVSAGMVTGVGGATIIYGIISFGSVAMTTMNPIGWALGGLALTAGTLMLGGIGIGALINRNKLKGLFSREKVKYLVDQILVRIMKKPRKLKNKDVEEMTAEELEKIEGHVANYIQSCMDTANRFATYSLDLFNNFVNTYRISVKLGMNVRGVGSDLFAEFDKLLRARQRAIEAINLSALKDRVEFIKRQGMYGTFTETEMHDALVLTMEKKPWLTSSEADPFALCSHFENLRWTEYGPHRLSRLYPSDDPGGSQYAMPSTECKTTETKTSESKEETKSSTSPPMTVDIAIAEIRRRQLMEHVTKEFEQTVDGKYEFVRVDLIKNKNSDDLFKARIRKLQRQRENAAKNKLFNTSGILDADGNVDEVKQAGLLRMKTYFAENKFQTTLEHVNLMFVWHGCPSEDVGRAISETGFADLSITDAGYFGRGVYTTPQAKYASDVYAKRADDGLKCLIFAVVAVGNTYILSRKTDYEKVDGSPVPMCRFDCRYGHPPGESGDGKALKKNGFDSHFVSISAKEGYQADDVEPEFDEIVTHESQVLPLCRVVIRAKQHTDN